MKKIRKNWLQSLILLFSFSFLNISASAALIDFESFNLNGAVFLDVGSPLVFNNVSGSGVSVSIQQGADNRIYDLLKFSGNQNTSGQALIDFNFPSGSNPIGTTILFDKPVSKFSLQAGDFGSDDDSPLSVSAFDGNGNLLASNSVSWTSDQNPPFATLTINANGIKSVVFTSGGAYANSVFIDNISFTPNPVPTSVVDSADLTANSISVTLSGLGSSAPSPLNIELVGEQNSFQTSFNNGENVGEGTHLITLDRPSIPEDIYTKIIATWKLSTGDVISQDYLISPVWRVLGIVRHSQYNTPAEKACNGRTKTSWVFDSNCNFTNTTFNSKFALQVYINGTGRSIQHGIIKYSKLCSSNYPRGANTRNSFLLVGEITGSCNKAMTNNFQAAYPNPKKSGSPDCGDTTLLVEESNSNKDIKEIQDYCPACKDGHHIDNYTDIEACSGGAVGDLGNFWTVIIGEK